MKKLALVCSLMLVLIPAILAGCTSTGAGTVPTNLRELSFSDLWNKTVNATGVNEASAYIADFSLYIGTNGSFGLRFDFFGSDTAGHCKMYSVGTDSTGRRSTESYSTDVIDINRQTINPGVLFDELDKAGLAGMFSPHSTITISSSCEWGGPTLYNNDFAKLYLLNECGELIPLKQISFSSTIPWFTLSIFTMTEAEGGTFRLASEMWILSQDLAKATDVEYLNLTANESSFGIYMVDTGELIISEQDIQSYNASTYEIALNEAGIEKWNSFFPNAWSLHGSQFAVKVNGEEMYRGNFTSLASSMIDYGTYIFLPFDNETTIPIYYNCRDPRVDWRIFNCFATTTPSTFGIYLVDTGALMISQEDVKSYNISTHEIELNAEGIKRWNSFFPDIWSLDGKLFAVNVDGEEIYRGRFQSPFSSFAYIGEVTISSFPELSDEFNTISIGYNCFDPRDNPYINDFFESAGLLK